MEKISIFISHSLSDLEPIRLLGDCLGEYGHVVYARPGSIMIGGPQADIAIDSSDRVLALATAGGGKAWELHDEVAYAQEKGKRIVALVEKGAAAILPEGVESLEFTMDDLPGAMSRIETLGLKDDRNDKLLRATIVLILGLVAFPKLEEQHGPSTPSHRNL